MGTIRVVVGAGSAPTEMASYDAALADAGVHNYNLVPVSSVVPADADVAFVGTAPDLGPAGERLTVVEARATVSEVGRAVAGLGWATGPGPGLFYEATGGGVDAVRSRIEAGLDAGADLRDWELDDRRVETEGVTHDGEGFATAVAVAAYGGSEPIL
jgi:arginine decarboxylase